MSTTTDRRKAELVAAALAAYGVTEADLIPEGCSVSAFGDVTLITRAGHRVRWSQGDSVVPLTPAQAGRTRKGAER